MSDEMNRLTSRFAKQFADGLANVKYFLHPGHHPTLDQFATEAIALEDSTSVKRVNSIDATCEQVRFDAPFRSPA